MSKTQSRKSDEIVTAIDHLFLKDQHRQLITEACGNSRQVQLAPLDKGLSGSQVWLARWVLPGGIDSKYHVFKIGVERKLKRERDAIAKVASVIDTGCPHAELFVGADTKNALLRQEFVGASGSPATSLKQHIHALEKPRDVRSIINRLYHDRMRQWHNANDNSQPVGTPKIKTYGDALKFWWTKYDLLKTAKRIGKKALDNYLTINEKIGLEEIHKMLLNIHGERDELIYGPVHGDLHAQNVLVDEDDQLHLIDYGWTSLSHWRCVDFLMLECSMKFLVTPLQAEMSDVVEIEHAVDESILSNDRLVFGNLKNRTYGVELQKIATGIHAIRKSAIDLGAATNLRQYKKGLAMMTGCLISISHLNTMFMFRSLAHLTNELKYGEKL